MPQAESKQPSQPQVESNLPLLPEKPSILPAPAEPNASAKIGNANELNAKGVDVPPGNVP